jgi:quinol monooxygenase YgiN
VLDELFVDNAAITAHRATPHFTNYIAHINDLADRTALMLDPV